MPVRYIGIRCDAIMYYLLNCVVYSNMIEKAVIYTKMCSLKNVSFMLLITLFSIFYNFCFSTVYFKIACVVFMISISLFHVQMVH